MNPNATAEIYRSRYAEQRRVLVVAAVALSVVLAVLVGTMCCKAFATDQAFTYGSNQSFNVSDKTQITPTDETGSTINNYVVVMTSETGKTYTTSVSGCRPFRMSDCKGVPSGNYHLKFRDSHGKTYSGPQVVYKTVCNDNRQYITKNEETNTTVNVGSNNDGNNIDLSEERTSSTETQQQDAEYNDASGSEDSIVCGPSDEPSFLDFFNFADADDESSDASDDSDYSDNFDDFADDYADASDDSDDCSDYSDDFDNYADEYTDSYDDETDDANDDFFDDEMDDDCEDDEMTDSDYEDDETQNSTNAPFSFLVA